MLQENQPGERLGEMGSPGRGAETQPGVSGERLHPEVCAAASVRRGTRPPRCAAPARSYESPGETGALGQEHWCSPGI